MRHSYPTAAKYLPFFIKKILFGDRKNYRAEDERDTDPDWNKWQKCYWDFYQNTQKAGVGKIVNDAGYRILNHINLEKTRCLEIGPGTLPHIHFWKGKPFSYDIVDVRNDFLDASMSILHSHNVNGQAFLLSSFNQISIPVPDETYDCILSFYSLEHLTFLSNHLREYNRLLKPKGVFIGAIPAEGGLAWGSGRALTSRRYAQKHYDYNFDKIIAWEHCNTASDILHACDDLFEFRSLHFWPLMVPLIDMNLVIRFIYHKA